MAGSNKENAFTRRLITDIHPGAYGLALAELEAILTVESVRSTQLSRAERREGRENGRGENGRGQGEGLSEREEEALL